MKYKFTDLFDIPALTALCQSFTDINGVVTALLDLEGKVHIATGWQDICTQFHRKNKETACRCTKSDTFLAGQLKKGCDYNVYKCENGLVDIAVPVYVDGEHVANFFTGQFFYQPPDVSFFKKQANTFGFDEESYLEALNRTPIYSEEQIKINMAFLVKLTQVIGEMGRDRLEKIKANEQLLLLATTDSLTGVLNRSAFVENAEQYLKLSARNETPLQFVMIDIDHFKGINDRHGHHGGDRVLIEFAKYVTAQLREADLFGRVGGEEFCLVLQNTKNEGGDIYIEKLRKGLETLIIQFEEKVIDVRVSIGITSYCKNDSYESISKRADLALYEAKNSGRNKVVRYSRPETSGDEK